MATANNGKREIDIVDLLPAQVAGLMFLIQFEIVTLIAYDGKFDLEQTFSFGPLEATLAFLVSAGALAIIILTNELTADDVMFWEEDAGELDQAYGFAIAGTFALLIAVEFWPYAAELVTGSDAIKTGAFLLSVAAVWAIVWVR